MAGSMGVGMGYETASALSRAASEVSNQLQAMSAMVFIWESGCKPAATRPFLLSMADLYAKQIDLTYRR